MYAADQDDIHEEARPWEQPGAVRRDCEPHRGLLVYRMGLAACVCSLLSPWVFPALVAVSLGVATWRMGRYDLSEMAAGRVDPAGGRTTAQGRDMALGAVVVAVVGLVCAAAAYGFFLWMLTR